jgi:hypothetical protein
MYAHDAIHPGLIAMPGSYGRARQRELAATVIAWIRDAAVHAGESPADYMLNRLVEIDDAGVCTARELPAA